MCSVNSAYRTAIPEKDLGILKCNLNHFNASSPLWQLDRSARFTLLDYVEYALVSFGISVLFRSNGILLKHSP